MNRQVHLIDGDASSASSEPARQREALPRHGLLIEVEAVSQSVEVRRRGEVTLLDAVSFTIAPGELVAIVGPSGAGKTTLLEAIAGWPRQPGISALRRRRRARQPSGLPRCDRLCAPGRHHSRRATTATLTSLRRRGCGCPSSTSAAEVDEAVRTAIATVGLTEHADVRVGAFSGGSASGRASLPSCSPTHGCSSSTSPPPVSTRQPAPTSSPTCAHWPTARRPSSSPHTRSRTSPTATASCSWRAAGGSASSATWMTRLHHFEVDSIPALYRRLTDSDVSTRPWRQGADQAADRAPNRRHRPASCGRPIHPMECAHPPYGRDLRAQPVDTRHPARLTGSRRRHVRHPLSTRDLRVRRPRSELDGHDRFLDRLCCVLLRHHVRPAPDLHRTHDREPRAPRWAAARRLRRIQGHRSRAIPAGRHFGHAGRAPAARPTTEPPRCRPTHR